MYEISGQQPTNFKTFRHCSQVNSLRDLLDYFRFNRFKKSNNPKLREYMDEQCAWTVLLITGAGAGAVHVPWPVTATALSSCVITQHSNVWTLWRVATINHTNSTHVV